MTSATKLTIKAKDFDAKDYSNDEQYCLNVWHRGFKVGAYLTFAKFGRKEYQGPICPTPFVWIGREAGILEANSPAKTARRAAFDARPCIELGDVITIEGFGDYRVELTHNNNFKLVAVNGTDPVTAG